MTRKDEQRIKAQLLVLQRKADEIKALKDSVDRVRLIVEIKNERILKLVHENQTQKEKLRKYEMIIMSYKTQMNEKALALSDCQQWKRRHYVEKQERTLWIASTISLVVMNILQLANQIAK